jgi:hypothetical protein
MDDLFPWTVYPDHRWVGVGMSIQETGMIYPVITISMTGNDWYQKSMFRRKPWKLPYLWQLPPRNDDPVLAVRIGCQKIQYANYAGYDQIDGIVTSCVKEAKDVWRNIGGAATARA